MIGGMSVDPKQLPHWLHKADRQRRLLALGVSLTEQRNRPIYELDALLAVDSVYKEAEAEEIKRANKRRRELPTGRP